MAQDKKKPAIIKKTRHSGTLLTGQRPQTNAGAAAAGLYLFFDDLPGIVEDAFKNTSRLNLQEVIVQSVCVCVCDRQRPGWLPSSPLACGLLAGNVFLLTDGSPHKKQPQKTRS